MYQIFFIFLKMDLIQTLSILLHVNICHLDSKTRVSFCRASIVSLSCVILHFKKKHANNGFKSLIKCFKYFKDFNSLLILIHLNKNTSCQSELQLEDGESRGSAIRYSHLP